MDDHNLADRDFRQSKDAILIVDPGFVHHRKIEAILGRAGTEIINNEIAKIPHQTPEWKKKVNIDHIYTRILLDFCKLLDIRTLEENIAKRKGHLMCSIEKFRPTNTIFNSIRASSAYSGQADPVKRDIDPPFFRRIVSAEGGQRA